MSVRQFAIGAQSAAPPTGATSRQLDAKRPTADSVAPPYRARWIWCGTNLTLRNRDSQAGWTNDLRAREGYSYPMPRTVNFTLANSVQPVVAGGRVFVGSLEGTALRHRRIRRGDALVAPLPGGTSVASAAVVGNVVVFADSREPFTVSPSRMAVLLGWSRPASPSRARPVWLAIPCTSPARTSMYIPSMPKAARCSGFRRGSTHRCRWPRSGWGKRLCRIGGHDGIRIAPERRQHSRHEPHSRAELSPDASGRAWRFRVFHELHDADDGERIHQHTDAGRREGHRGRGCHIHPVVGGRFQRWTMASRIRGFSAPVRVTHIGSVAPFLIPCGPSEGVGLPPDPPSVDGNGRVLCWWPTKFPKFTKVGAFGTKYSLDICGVNLTNGHRVPIDNGRLSNMWPGPETDNLYAMSVGGDYLWLRQAFRGTQNIRLTDTTHHHVSARVRHEDGGNFGADVVYFDQPVRQTATPNAVTEGSSGAVVSQSNFEGRTAAVIVGDRVYLAERFGVTALEHRP